MAVYRSFFDADGIDAAWSLGEIDAAEVAAVLARFLPGPSTAAGRGHGKPGDLPANGSWLGVNGLLVPSRWRATGRFDDGRGSCSVW
jgi:hypothetical protein